MQKKVNLLIIGVDNSSSPQIDQSRNNFLVLGEGPIEGINGRVAAAEKKSILTLIKQIQNLVYVHM